LRVRSARKAGKVTKKVHIFGGTPLEETGFPEGPGKGPGRGPGKAFVPSWRERH
jgi:hypothetical protein